MFTALGSFTARRRRWVLAATVAVLVFAGVWGTQVFGALKSGGLADPNSESARAATLLDERLGAEPGEVIVLYRSATMTVDDPRFRTAVTTTLDRLPRDQVLGTASYWSTRSPALVSHDRHATYASVRLRGATQDDRRATYKKIRDDLVAPGLTTDRGGSFAVGTDIGAQTGRDLGRAESMSTPILLVLLLVIFGSAVAACLPLAIGGVAILGAFTALRLITMTTDVSTFVINIVTMLGLGLAIDYALFIVSRYREELAAGASERDALITTMATAGRTVAFSGVTVAIALSGLLFFPQMMLRSMGLGGIAVVLVDMIAALTVLPALLAVLGHRVDALCLRRRRTPQGIGGRGWARLAHTVMRRPVIGVLVPVLVILTLGAPLRGIKFGSADVSVLPKSAESRVVTDTLNRDFAHGTLAPVEIAVSGDVARPDLDAYAARLRGLGGVADAAVARTGPGIAEITAALRADPQSSQARAVVREIRALPRPPGTDRLLVGGVTAALLDLIAGIGRTVPWTLLFVGAVSFLLMFAALGSLLLPLKALVMNALSLGAAFGVMTWGFAQGHLAGPLGFTSTGTVEATQPVVLVAVAFGLSMDYELFLLTRIREEWDRTGDNREAVATGLQRSGRIITNAALLLSVVIGAFMASGIVFLKLIGVGLVVAVLLDATLVRAILVPAVMRLLGPANWWLPGPLRALHARVALRENEARPGGGLPVTPRTAEDAAR